MAPLQDYETGSPSVSVARGRPQGKFTTTVLSMTEKNRRLHFRGRQRDKGIVQLLTSNSAKKAPGGVPGPTLAEVGLSPEVERRIQELIKPLG